MIVSWYHEDNTMHAVTEPMLLACDNGDAHLSSFYTAATDQRGTSTSVTSPKNDFRPSLMTKCQSYGYLTPAVPDPEQGDFDMLL